MSVQVDKLMGVSIFSPFHLFTFSLFHLFTLSPLNAFLTLKDNVGATQ